MKAFITSLSVASVMVFSSHAMACSGADKDKYAESSPQNVFETVAKGEVKVDQPKTVQSSQ